jgi:hypothetical protein
MEETIFRYYTLDSHTEVISVDLTPEEKQELGIDENKFAHLNEIGFSTPVDSNEWEEDCFNVLIGETPDDEEFDVLLLPISRLPKRFEATHRYFLKEREKYYS